MRRLQMLVSPLDWDPLADFLPLEPPFVTFEAMVLLSMRLHGSFVVCFCLGLLSAGVGDFPSAVVC